MRVARLYSRLVADEAVRERMFGAHRRRSSAAGTGAPGGRGAGALLDDKPFLQQSIRLRNPYIDPLHDVQVRLLAQLRAETTRRTRRPRAPPDADGHRHRRGLRNTG